MNKSQYFAMIKQAVAVVSSHIADVEYNAETGTMTITWQNGRKYEYFRVPAEIHAGIMAAESKGRYFNQNIRGKFEFQEI